MTSIRIQCPQCQRELILPDRKLLGRKGKCPKCGFSFILEEPPEVVLNESDTALSDPDTTPDVPKHHRTSDADVKLVKSSRQLPPLPDELTTPDDPSETSVRGRFEGLELNSLPAESTAENYRKNQQFRSRRGAWSFGVISGICLLLAAICFGVYTYHPEWIGLADVDEAEVDEEVVSSDESTPASPAVEDSAPAEPEVAAIDQPTQGAPIDMRMIPAGTKVLIHLHPEQLWAPKSPGEEFWACLPPIRLALEQLITRLSHQQQLANLQSATLSLIPGPKGSPPDWAGVFVLKSELKQSEMLALFHGARSDEYGSRPVYVSEGLAFCQRDAKSYAVAPEKYAADFAAAFDRPFPMTQGLDELLAKTDSDRQMTILFEPNTLLVHAEALTTPEYRALFESFFTWFGKQVETVSWSGHVAGQKFYGVGHLRGTLDIRPTRLSEQFRKQLAKFPSELLPFVASLNPNDLGRRKIVGRTPAMAQVVSLATTVSPDATTAKFVTVLPDRAVPNLALGAILTWDESRRPRSTQGPVVAATPVDANRQKSFADRFDKTRFEVEFARTRLEDAFLYIGEQAQLKVEVDGKALMLVGVTKNEEQNFKLASATAREAIQAIFANKKDYATKLCLVVDEANNSILVTSIPKAEQQGLKQFPINP